MTPVIAQRTFDDVSVGDEVAVVEFPLSIYRLVVAAGGNRDFNSIHHNSSYAKASGAPDMYASTFILIGAWERVVRDFIGRRRHDPLDHQLPDAQVQPGRLDDDGRRPRHRHAHRRRTGSRARGRPASATTSPSARARSS